MTTPTITFKELNIPDPILRALTDLGYEQPSSIQAESIPLLLKGKNLLAQAKTGTGKTAAFCIPILCALIAEEKKTRGIKALILTPTRELAIQVAEAFNSFAKYIQPFRVVPIYGGQNFKSQLRALEHSGAQVVVGTPGRIMDHFKRRTIVTDNIKHIVLDEADEMLKMGFLEDVQWILSQIKQTHQKCLFSATMPPAIKQISSRYLKDHEEIKILSKTKSVMTIEQGYMLVDKITKIEALTRYLAAEQSNAVIIFVRTKILSVKIADKLRDFGYAVEAMNGDLKQSQREKVIKRLKMGNIDVIVATELAARGLDIDRISHVINFDPPHNGEAYIHRIGRTGRAGKEGKSLLLLTYKEKYVLRDLERSLNQRLISIPLPPPVHKKERIESPDAPERTLVNTDTRPSHEHRRRENTRPSYRSRDRADSRSPSHRGFSSDAKGEKKAPFRGRHQRQEKRVSDRRG